MQRKAHEALHKKSSTGDIAPKPAINFLLPYSKDAYMFLSKATPFVSKSMSSSLGLGFMIAAGGIILVMDDTSRNMIIDQVSQIMALFQNDNIKSESSETNNTVDKNNANLKIESSPAKPYQHPNYYL